jgi:hypothetical protein
LTGKALASPLAGQALSRLKSTSSFWFRWKFIFPKTKFYGLPEE